MVEIKFAFGAANASMATRGVEAVLVEVVDEMKSLSMGDCKIHCAASKIADKEWKMRSGD